MGTMKPRANTGPHSSQDDVQLALAGMGADELRQVVHEILAELDDRTRERLAGAILHRGAHVASGGLPAALEDSEVAEVLAFAEAARRAGHADPAEVDDRLRRGSDAFLRKDYGSTYQIFDALLQPIADADVDLGQDEMIDEVLAVDAKECALQYVVSAYMTSEPGRRAEVVRAAIAKMGGAGYFWEPIKEMERAAVEPLPGLADFLPAWRAMVEPEAAGARHGSWDSEADRWLREVVRRIEGPGGLANVARSTRRTGDLQAWCESLIEAGEWKAALAAFEEAADIASDQVSARGGFLDGAALAAQELGTKDVSPWLERAWRTEPTMARLCRWLGAAGSKPSFHERVVEALRVCPPQALRQRAFLHALQGDMKQAAELLAAAPGLGWSDRDHPGHLLFPLFQALLRGGAPSRPSIGPPGGGPDVDGLELCTAEGDDEPQLTTPKIDDLLRDAGVEGASDAAVRSAVLCAMRKAAEKRVAGVTEQKRRRHYGHAASLVAACVACDGSREMARWAATLRKGHRRFPALCAELDRRVGCE